MWKGSLERAPQLENETLLLPLLLLLRHVALEQAAVLDRRALLVLVDTLLSSVISNRATGEHREFLPELLELAVLLLPLLPRTALAFPSDTAVPSKLAVVVAEEGGARNRERGRWRT